MPCNNIRTSHLELLLGVMCHWEQIVIFSVWFWISSALHQVRLCLRLNSEFFSQRQGYGQPIMGLSIILSLAMESQRFLMQKKKKSCFKGGSTDLWQVLQIKKKKKKNQFTGLFKWTIVIKHVLTHMDVQWFLCNNQTFERYLHRWNWIHTIPPCQASGWWECRTNDRERRVGHARGKEGQVKHGCMEWDISPGRRA